MSQVMCGNCEKEVNKDEAIPYTLAYDDETYELVPQEWICSECTESRILALLDILNDPNLAYDDIDTVYMDETKLEAEGCSYLVLTDREADEHLEMYWGSENYFWKMDVKNDLTEMGFSEWVQDLVNNGDRSVLASADGQEYESYVDGVYYYVYRTN